MTFCDTYKVGAAMKPESRSTPMIQAEEAVGGLAILGTCFAIILATFYRQILNTLGPKDPLGPMGPLVDPWKYSNLKLYFNKFG